MFAVLIEGYNYFYPFYVGALAPCVEEDLLKLRVNKLVFQTMTLKVNIQTSIKKKYSIFYNSFIFLPFYFF